jgi:hypothetical protein
MSPRLARALVALSLVALPATSHAYTQWAAALTLGGGARLTPSQQREALVSVGLRADALFGPRDATSLRAGPFVAGWSDDFDSLVAAAGASLLLPIATDTPLVVSMGATYSVTARERLPVGVMGRVWWGSRSMNLHASYGMSSGLWLEARYAPDGGALDVVVGLDGDLAFISLPAVVLWNWLTR